MSLIYGNRNSPLYLPKSSGSLIEGVSPVTLPTSPLGILSNVALWLCADLGITLNGSNVSAWADQSGAGNNFVQATGANQPAYTGTLNGRTVPVFDGAASFMTSTPGLGVSGAYFVGMVIVPVALVGGYTGLLVGASQVVYMTLAATDKWGGFNNQFTSNTVSILATEAPSAVLYNSTATNNGTAYTNGAPNAIALGTGYNSKTATGLGADPSGVQFANVKIAEVVACSSTQSAAQISAIRAYFSAKWGFAA